MNFRILTYIMAMTALEGISDRGWVVGSFAISRVNLKRRIMKLTHAMRRAIMTKPVQRRGWSSRICLRTANGALLALVVVR
jgi:hypothetical protein